MLLASINKDLLRIHHINASSTHALISQPSILYLRHMQRIGKITGTHGLKGEVSFSHQLKRGCSFDQWDCLMVEINPESYIPFFIEEIRRISDDECICKLEELNSRDEAKAISQCNIYTSINYQIENRTIDNIRDWIGFEVIDHGKKLGTIHDAIDSKWNQMFVMNYNGKEVLIPSQPAFIESINAKERIIYMTLPEGLLEL